MKSLPLSPTFLHFPIRLPTISGASQPPKHHSDGLPYPPTSPLNGDTLQSTPSNPSVSRSHLLRRWQRQSAPSVSDQQPSDMPPRRSSDLQARPIPTEDHRPRLHSLPLLQSAASPPPSSRSSRPQIGLPPHPCRPTPLHNSDGDHEIDPLQSPLHPLLQNQSHPTAHPSPPHPLRPQPDPVDGTYNLTRDLPLHLLHRPTICLQLPWRLNRAPSTVDLPSSAQIESSSIYQSTARAPTTAIDSSPTAHPPCSGLNLLHLPWILNSTDPYQSFPIKEDRLRFFQVRPLSPHPQVPTPQSQSFSTASSRVPLPLRLPPTPHDRSRSVDGP